MGEAVTEVEIEQGEFEASARRFLADTKNHQMQVILDQGVHRHLRFRAPGSGMYWFDLVTVPGALIFMGDGEAFVFRRVDDMFEFFRARSGWNGGTINPHYWSEKLVDAGGRWDRSMRYSEGKFKEHVEEQLKVAEESGDWTAEQLAQIRTAVASELDNWVDTSYEESAREFLRDFTYTVPAVCVDGTHRSGMEFTFDQDSAMEADLRDWYWWFLWVCHAIQWGIDQYDKLKIQAADTKSVDTIETKDEVL